MKYFLEKISFDDRKKILNDAQSNERILGFLKMRGGHFSNNPDLKWAIDRGCDSYIFWAPRPAMTAEYHYCFFYEKKLYIIYIKSPTNTTVFFDEKSPPPKPFNSDMKTSIAEAMAVHGLFGSVSDKGMDAHFKDEEKCELLGRVNSYTYPLPAANYEGGL